jgi:MFS family permease
MGLGVAALFPLTLRVAARNAETAGPDLAAVSSLGYLGFLLGPPTIGVLAEQTSLRIALLLVCGACLAALERSGESARRSPPDSYGTHLTRRVACAWNGWTAGVSRHPPQRPRRPSPGLDGAGRFRDAAVH